MHSNPWNKWNRRNKKSAFNYVWFYNGYFFCSNVTISSSARKWLRSPEFDVRQWTDEELLLMLETMFVELHLPQRFSICLSTLRNFIFEVYCNYNEVPFHNFKHCFCVTQMVRINNAGKFIMLHLYFGYLRALRTIYSYFFLSI